MDKFEVGLSAWSAHLSQDKEAYLDSYAVEINLNDTFNTFVSNFQLAYQGPNTARHQIGAKFNTSKSFSAIRICHENIMSNLAKANSSVVQRTVLFWTKK